jgi:hypothetical protein
LELVIHIFRSIRSGSSLFTEQAAVVRAKSSSSSPPIEYFGVTHESTIFVSERHGISRSVSTINSRKQLAFTFSSNGKTCTVNPSAAADFFVTNINRDIVTKFATTFGTDLTLVDGSARPTKFFEVVRVPTVSHI